MYPSRKQDVDLFNGSVLDNLSNWLYRFHLILFVALRALRQFAKVLKVKLTGQWLQVKLKSCQKKTEFHEKAISFHS